MALKIVNNNPAKDINKYNFLRWQKPEYEAVEALVFSSDKYAFVAWNNIIGGEDIYDVPYGFETNMVLPECFESFCDYIKYDTEEENGTTYHLCRFHKNTNPGSVYIYDYSAPALNNGGQTHYVAIGETVTIKLYRLRLSANTVQFYVKFGTNKVTVSTNGNSYFEEIDIEGTFTGNTTIELGIEHNSNTEIWATLNGFRYYFTESAAEIPTIAQPFNSNLIENAYVRIKNKAFLAAMVGDTISFFINRALADMPYPNNANVKVLDINANVVASIAGNLSDPGDYYYFKSFVFPNIPNGIYRLGINYYTNGIVLVSNPIMVVGSDIGTLKVKFRHDSNHYGYQYESEDLSSFYNEFRIFATQTDLQYETNMELYQSVTTGIRRQLKDSNSKFRKFETYFFDEDMHEAASIMMKSSEIYINGMRHDFKDNYKIKTAPNSDTSKGEFEMYEKDFTINQ